MSEFDNTFNEEYLNLTEGKFKSMVAAGLVGLGSTSGVDAGQLKQFQPKPYTQTKTHSDDEVLLEEPHIRHKLTNMGYSVSDLLSKKASISKKDAKAMLTAGVQESLSDAKRYLPNFDTQPLAVKIILTDMAYNLGLTKLNKFVNLKGALMAHDYTNATKEMINSNWYKQTKRRSKRHVSTMEKVANMLNQQ